MPVVLLKRNIAILACFWRFLLVGGGVNLFALAIYYVASILLGLHHVVSLSIASGLSFPIYYFANRNWTFRFGETGAFSRFVAGYIASFVFQALVLKIGVDGMGFPHEWVVLCGLVLATGVSFLLQRYWVFNARKASLIRVPGS